MERMSCPNCGAPTTGVDRFCQNCGFALTGDTPVRSAPVAPPPPLGFPPAPVPPPPGFPPAPTSGPYGTPPTWDLASPPPPASDAAGLAPAGVRPLLEYGVAYPERLSRLLIFVKWLLIIPHLIIVCLIGIIASIALVIAWFAILFTGRMPRGLHDFITGYTRWSFRVLTYLLLLTDAYPPFTLDHVPSPSRPGGRTALPY